MIKVKFAIPNPMKNIYSGKFQIFFNLFCYCLFLFITIIACVLVVVTHSIIIVVIIIILFIFAFQFFYETNSYFCSFFRCLFTRRNFSYLLFIFSSLYSSLLLISFSLDLYSLFIHYYHSF